MSVENRINNSAERGILFSSRMPQNIEVIRHNLELREQNKLNLAKGLTKEKASVDRIRHNRSSLARKLAKPGCSDEKAARYRELIADADAKIKTLEEHVQWFNKRIEALSREIENDRQTLSTMSTSGDGLTAPQLRMT